MICKSIENELLIFSKSLKSPKRKNQKEKTILSIYKHYEVNVRATCLLCVEFARRFKYENQKAGRIINLTSGQKQGPMTGTLEYVATKGAILCVTKSAAIAALFFGYLLLKCSIYYPLRLSPNWTFFGLCAAC